MTVMIDGVNYDDNYEELEKLNDPEKFTLFEH